MKKLLAALLLLFLLPLSACSATLADTGSGTSASIEENENQISGIGQWVKVQNVLYYPSYASGRTDDISISSEYSWDAEVVESSREEAESSGLVVEINPLRRALDEIEYNEQINRQKAKEGKTEYAIDINGMNIGTYHRVSYKKLNIYYVYVNFFSDGTFGIRYCEEDTYIEKRIMSPYYEITYFAE